MSLEVAIAHRLGAFELEADFRSEGGLTALFGEYPVMLANVSAPRDKRPRTLDPSAFQFVAGSAYSSCRRSARSATAR